MTNSIAPYRDALLRAAPALAAVGLGYIGEDETSMLFMDRCISLRFGVEPGAGFLDAYVEFMSDTSPDDTVYGLNTIIALQLQQELPLPDVRTEAGRLALVERYVAFVTSHKRDLFAETFPLAARYQAHRARNAVEIKAMFARHAPRK